MNTLIVDVGKAEAFRDRNRIIKITLGSCVGAVLFDRKYRIFGAIHILLPKYLKLYAKDHAITAFADKGLEYLLNQMLKFYNNKEIPELSAVVAGGAELGGKSLYNVGRHNCKETIKFIEKNRIKLEGEDCLKDYPRELLFNTSDLSFEIINIKEKVITPSIKFDERKKILQDINKHFPYLAVPNSVITRLLELRNNENITISIIESIVKKDDSLAIDLIKYANSPIFGRSKRVTDIKQAITTIGLKKFFNFVSTQLLKGFVHGDLESYMIDAKSYKLHVLCVAMLSESMADVVSFEPSKAYLAGLFHDIGKIILDRYAIKTYKEHNRAQLISFIEESIETTTHAYVGAEFLKTIGFEEDITDAVFYHHFPLQAPEPYKKLACIVAASNILVSNYLFGTNNYLTTTTLDNEVDIFDKLQLTKEDIEALVSQIGYFVEFAEEIITNVR